MYSPAGSRPHGCRFGFLLFQKKIAIGASPTAFLSKNDQNIFRVIFYVGVRWIHGAATKIYKDCCMSSLVTTSRRKYRCVWANNLHMTIGT